MAGNPTEFHERRMLYLQVRDYILNQIEEGVLVPGEKIPPERELAEKLNVSRYTARRALQELVDEGVLYRVQGSGTYIRERNNSHKRLDAIGIVMPFVEAEIEMMILCGMQRALRRTPYTMMLYTSHNDSAKEAEAVSLLTSEGVAGLILMPSHDKGAGMSALPLKRDGFPFVMVDRTIEAFQANCVVSDNQQGGNQAARHLLDLGHRKICFLYHQIDTSSSIRQRLRGFKEAFREHDVSGGDSYAFDHQKGVEELKAFLQMQEYTAVVAGNATVAASLITACRDLKLSIPKDLSIVSFDDLKMVRMLDVSLTTVNQHSELMGEKAVELLLYLIENGDDQLLPLTQLYLPTALMVGNSCQKLA
ncbi:MAG: GntR family transcriptional regulator, partial [Bacillota bacterium]|nr:GntR family transcriptional regulator [Bacillota bacterium]